MMASSALSSLNISTSSTSFATRRGQCKSAPTRSCHRESKALYIFLSPWPSPPSVRSLFLCWPSALSFSSKFCICFILIFSHLVITSSNAEQVNKNEPFVRNSANRALSSSGQGIYFNDNASFGGSNGDSDRIGRLKPKTSSSHLRDAFSSIEGSGSGINNPNEDDEDGDDDIDNGSGYANPDGELGMTQGTSSTTISSTSSTTTTTEPSTTTTTTPGSTTTTTTTPAPSSVSTLDPDMEEDEDLEGSGSRSSVIEGSGAGEPDKPGVPEEVPGNSDNSSSIDQNRFEFKSTPLPEPTQRSTSTSTPAPIDSGDYYDQVDPKVSEGPADPSERPSTGPTEIPPNSEPGSDDLDDDIFPDPERKQSPHPPFFARPGILAAIIGGTVVGLLCAIILVMFIVYRMRKKDEGSYPLEAHTFRGNKVKECRYA